MSTELNEGELLVVSQEWNGEIVDVGAVAAKAMPPGRRYRYSRKVRYTLSDGKTLDRDDRAMTKPKLQEEFDSTGKMIAGKCFLASPTVHTPDGWCLITRVRISLLGR